MITVIYPDDPDKIRCRCEGCKCVLEFLLEDRTRHEISGLFDQWGDQDRPSIEYSITCPVCSKGIWFL